MAHASIRAVLVTTQDFVHAQFGGRSLPPACSASAFHRAADRRVVLTVLFFPLVRNSGGKKRLWSSAYKQETHCVELLDYSEKSWYCTLASEAQDTPTLLSWDSGLSGFCTCGFTQLSEDGSRSPRREQLSGAGWQNEAAQGTSR